MTGTLADRIWAVQCYPIDPGGVLSPLTTPGWGWQLVAKLGSASPKAKAARRKRQDPAIKPANTLPKRLPTDG